MTQQTATVQQQPQVSDLVDHLVQFDGPPEQFLLHLLAVQCHVGSADGGAIVRAATQGKPEVLALFPPPKEQDEPAPQWLNQAMQVVPRTLQSAETVVTPVNLPDQLYGQGPEAFLLLVPLRGGAGVRGAAAFLVASRDPAFVDQCRQRLELTVSLLSLYEMRLTLQARRADLQRLRGSLEVLAAVNDVTRFKGAAMAFCNEVASALSAERVSLGFLKGRYVRVEGMSHTEKIVRKMELVQAIESAMEECLDQDVETVHPAPTEANYVSRAATALSDKHGPTSICSLPMRRGGETEAVITVERAVNQPFTLEEVETLRLGCDLCTARLLELREHDKWVGAKAASATRKGLATLVGPQHTWIKVTVMGVCAALVYISLYPAAWRVNAPFEVQTVEHHVIAAPFPGRIEKVLVERSDPIVAGETVLAVMETAELIARRASAIAQKQQYYATAQLAKREGKIAEEKIELHKIARMRAEIELLDYNIEKANIRSNITGVVTEGDLKGSEGATLQQGEAMFRVAPIDALRAELLVPEKRIDDVLTIIEQRRAERRKDGVADDDPDRRDGELAAVAYPGTYLPFVVERISPVAEVIEQRNVFRVRVRLQLHQIDDKPKWLRPGLEGVAKVQIGTASYAWLWSRDPVAWLRMKLWW